MIIIIICSAKIFAIILFAFAIIISQKFTKKINQNLKNKKISDTCTKKNISFIIKSFCIANL